jgi:hypothetical protein
MCVISNQSYTVGILFNKTMSDAHIIATAASQWVIFQDHLKLHLLLFKTQWLKGWSYRNFGVVTIA